MFRYIDALIFFCALTSTLKVNFSRSVLRSTEDVELLENDIKVYQTGTTAGFVQSNSTVNALMLASGSPAGILNSGGTTTSFSGTSSVNQHLPTNTSSSLGGSLAVNCAGGQMGTFIAGQDNIGFQSNSNCASFVDPNIQIPTKICKNCKAS